MAKKGGMYRVLAVTLVAALLGPTGAMAATYNLGDLITTGGSIFSDDGSVEFSGFAYVPSVGAPAAADIDIITEPAYPQGFRVDGTFTVDAMAASGPEGLQALLAFEADKVLDDWVLAKLELLDSIAVGVDASGIGSSVFVTEKVSSPNASVGALAVVDEAAGFPVLDSFEPLAGYDDPLSVLTKVSLLAIPDDTSGMGEATLEEFAVNFEAVPEPAAGLMLLTFGLATVIRRR
jgi:hypothetical protein